jgi:hypothetical protein
MIKVSRVAYAAANISKVREASHRAGRYRAFLPFDNFCAALQLTLSKAHAKLTGIRIIGEYAVIKALLVGCLLTASVASATAAPLRPNSVGTSTVAVAKIMPVKAVRAGTRGSDSSNLFGISVLPFLLIGAVAISAVFVIADDNGGNSP